MRKIDTGDTVYHRPTGEVWLVACVIGDNLSWCGWPEGWANLSDCDLREIATDEEKHALLLQLSSIPGDDHRKRYAIEKLKDVAI